MAAAAAAIFYYYSRVSCLAKREILYTPIHRHNCQPASQKSEVSRRSERFGLVINRVTTLSKEAAEEEEKKENQSASQLLLTFPRNKCTYNAQVVIKCDSITLVCWKGRWRLAGEQEVHHSR